MDEYTVYYKIYKSELLGGRLTVVCMQDFDEIDYKQNRFFNDKEGNMLKFYDESEAIQWLLDNIKEELIDPEYLKEKVIGDSKYYK